MTPESSFGIYVGIAITAVSHPHSCCWQGTCAVLDIRVNKGQGHNLAVTRLCRVRKLEWQHTVL